MEGSSAEFLVQISNDAPMDALFLLIKYVAQHAASLHPDLVNYVRDAHHERPRLCSTSMGKVAARAKYIEADATFLPHRFLKYLFHIVAYDNTLKTWHVVLRAFTSTINAGFYETVFTKFLEWIEEDDPTFDLLNWISIVLDFSKGQLKGLMSALKQWGDKHNIPADSSRDWVRSIERVVDIVAPKGRKSFTNWPLQSLR